MTTSTDKAAAVGDGSLRLRAPEHRLERRVVWYWAVHSLLGWLAFAAAQTVWMLLRDDGPVEWHQAGLVLTAVLGAAHVVVMPPWRYRVHRWETTPEAIYTQTGWFVEERRIAPVSRVQTVDSERGPLERLFKLTNVTATTASAAGPIKIHGLDHTTGLRLVADITAAAQASRGDAT
ncbi:PH domain-containing protein [Streptomyces sp. NPDC050610]|uniref:PH domain-containing protein n=1 Tax=Streptomyces sp. NPDC050610 TaxID=3157097 RepID=UPI0034284737